MKQYNLKSDLKKILYITSSIAGITGIFLIFSCAFLLPVYLLSKYFAKAYAIIVICAIISGIIVFFVLKLLKIWKKYNNPLLFLNHFLLYYLIPVFIVLFFLVFEGIAFRLFFYFFSPNVMAPTIIVLSLNIIVIILLILSRRFFHNWKSYLKEKEIKN
ncbi:MAG TPA: hypothetical protein PK385_04035 [Spirochaetota bacterium]|nr:hypothetical protein [Spirochaetota bacterium]HOS33283.1 hypothetical protein [Spirochaetota bacterium]HOS55208.1 hypothetical protein [Spirochaetota bacterium]HPK61440.1 hypothetical protein [Spirochaetota bacterium]HQF78561.1 hypothetical protein [Spirochaetota bacterium]